MSSATTTPGAGVRATASSPQVHLRTLSGRHYDDLTRGIRNVLATDIAEATFAQIVDGMPLASVDGDRFTGHICGLHPLTTQHTELCDGVIERTRRLYDEINLDSVPLNSVAVHEFQRAGPRSRAYKTRLVELVATAIHHTAVWIFQNNDAVHDGDALSTWAPTEEEDFVWWRRWPSGHPTTFFRHPWFKDHEQYPNGIADCVGYWAESRIFGGVVLFDRAVPHNDSIYIHPDRYYVTYRICKLLDGQKQDLLGLLLQGGDTAVSSSLPIIPTEANTARVDPEEPISETGVFRDPWERKDRRVRRGGDMRMKDVFSRLDWPGGIDDRNASTASAYRRKWVQDQEEAAQRRRDEEAENLETGGSAHGDETRPAKKARRATKAKKAKRG